MNNTNHTFSLFELNGWLVIIFGIVGSFVWAGLVPLDQGISASGFLIPQSEKIFIVSPFTGLITKLHKKNGDHIFLGEDLIEFDSQLLISNQRSIKQAITGLEISNTSLNHAFNSRKNQVTALLLQKDLSEKLVQSGYASPNSLATFQAQLSLAESESEELQSRIDQNSSRIKELKENINSIENQIQQLKIKSPATGQLMNVGLKSAGVHVALGTPLMEIVPDSEHLKVEARVPVDFSNQLQLGMPVEIMFPTLPGSNTLHIIGNLEYMSADKVVDQRTNIPYIEGRIAITEIDSELKKKLRAGLPVTLVILSGKRTLLSYIIRPLAERIQRGLQ
jgi:multidrug efflux pump subunit AcrA (membrane-fusion protein)